MCPPPKQKKPKPVAPIAAPEIKLGGEERGSPEAIRRRKQTGRNQLRTGLQVGGQRDSGLGIQTS